MAVYRGRQVLTAERRRKSSFSLGYTLHTNAISIVPTFHALPLAAPVPHVFKLVFRLLAC